MSKLKKKKNQTHRSGTNQSKRRTFEICFIFHKLLQWHCMYTLGAAEAPKGWQTKAPKVLQNPTRQLGKAVLLASECFDVEQSLSGEILVTGASLLQRQVFFGNTGKMQSQGPAFPATQLLACPRGMERWRQSRSQCLKGRCKLS